MLEEHDLSVREHGLQRMQEEQILSAPAQAKRPDREYLEERCIASAERSRHTGVEIDSALQMGTTVPVMGTIHEALFSKTRSAVLALLFGRPDERFHVRAIVRAAGVGSGSVQRELKTLEEAGLVERIGEGRQVYYRANARSPVFSELRALVAKTVGLADVIASALEPLAKRIRVALIYGSGARGALTAGSDVDVLVIGSTRFGDVVDALHEAQGRLGREVNPSVFTPAEWARRIRRGEHLASAVMRDEKVFLIGDERELAGLAGE